MKLVGDTHVCRSRLRFPAQVFSFLVRNPKAYLLGAGGGALRMGEWEPLQIYPFLYRSNKNTHAIVQINFFRTLEINQKMSLIWGAFIQEKLLTRSKNSGGLGPCTLAQVHRQEEGRRGLQPFKRLHLIDGALLPRDDATQGLQGEPCSPGIVIIAPGSECAQGETESPTSQPCCRMWSKRQFLVERNRNLRLLKHYWI